MFLLLSISSTIKILPALYKGVLYRQYNIILYIFLYKFISNIYYLSEIAFNTLFIIIYSINKSSFYFIYIIKEVKSLIS
jgi:hypothetical protein